LSHQVADVEDKKERTSVNLSASLLEGLERLAAKRRLALERNVFRSELVDEALRRYLRDEGIIA